MHILSAWAPAPSRREPRTSHRTRGSPMSTAPHPLAQRISVRRMDFAFSDDIPTYWHAGDPFRTLLFTALSGTFPEGEKFFVDAVRNYRDQIKDPELQRAVSAFIGQEA